MKEKQTHNKHSFAKPENENISDEVKKIIEHHSAEYEQWAYRLKTNIRHTTAVMAVLLLAFVLYCVVPNPVSDAPLQPTATVAQQSRPPEALQSSTSLLAAQTTDMPVTDTPILHHHDNKPATITDNEIKNTIVQSADRHDEPILTAEQNIITDVPTQKNETANLLQKHNAIAENIDTPKPKIYCSNGCSDEYIMGLFDECVLA